MGEVGEVGELWPDCISGRDTISSKLRRGEKLPPPPLLVSQWVTLGEVGEVAWVRWVSFSLAGRWESCKRAPRRKTKRAARR